MSDQERPERHEDVIARLLAEADQFGAGVNDLAGKLGVMREGFLAAGFSREEALHLVTVAFRAHLAATYGRGDPE